MPHKCSRQFITPIVYVAAASANLMMAYQSFSSEDLSPYDIVCGIANAVSSGLWFAASIYDIYLICAMKNVEQEFDNEQYNQQNNNIEDNLTYQNLINKLKIVDLSDIETKQDSSKNKKSFLKFSFFDKHGEEQEVLIPISKMNYEEYEANSDYSYEV